MKTFNENQMSDPWAWCLQVIERREVSPKHCSEATGVPHSTVRALYSGRNKNPRYDALVKIIRMCIDIENGGNIWEMASAGKVAEKQLKKQAANLEPSPDYDFL